MIILWRACEKQETISFAKRIKDLPKLSILKACWSSLQYNIGEKDKIIIIEDNLSDYTKEWLQQTCKASSLDFISVTGHKPDYHAHTVTFVKTLENTINNLDVDEIIFALEDDYLFSHGSITVLKEATKYWGGFIVPYDYPDRYKDGVSCRVLVGNDRHWRTVHSATMTILARASIWKKYLPELKELAPTSNDRIFEQKIFKETTCIAPLPGVATHLLPNTMTPLVDWNKIWNIHSEEKNVI